MFPDYEDQILDEIVFQSKNKEYGAYFLRKSYYYYLSYSLIIVVSIFTLFITGQLVFDLLTKKNGPGTTYRIAPEVLLLSEPPSIDNNLMERPENPVKNATTTNNISVPIVTEDELVNSDIFSKADTTGLQNVYSESTLNVEIKYPYGWTFLDQNSKNRLDGVTFWGSLNLYNPPPYIHLEVMDKELFIPAKYKYKSEYEDYTIYYNDPEVLSDQYSRLLYIRTQTDVDYTLKLIMKGQKQFDSFEPLFFGMVKSFSFGE